MFVAGELTNVVDVTLGPRLQTGMECTIGLSVLPGTHRDLATDCANEQCFSTKSGQPRLPWIACRAQASQSLASFVPSSSAQALLEPRHLPLIGRLLAILSGTIN